MLALSVPYLAPPTVEPEQIREQFNFIYPDRILIALIIRKSTFFNYFRIQDRKHGFNAIFTPRLHVVG